ncbi:MAG: S9 family peptidase [Chloroflexota bacterium]
MSADPAAALPLRPLRTDDITAVRWLADPRPSPDGARVACVERRVDAALGTVRARILVVRAADGSVATPSPDDAAAAAPRWRPDGSGLVFLAGRAGATTAWACDADGAGAAPIADLPDGIAAVEPLADGALLCMVRTERPGDAGAPLWEVPASGWRRDGLPDAERHADGAIVLRSPDGTLRTLARGTRDRAPAAAPDGATIALISARGVREGTGARSGIWLVARAGGPLRCLVPPTGRVSALAWAPDGSAIAWLGLRDGSRAARADRLHVTEIASGRTRTLPLPGVSAAGAAIRADDPRGMGDAPLAWTADGRIWLRWVTDGMGRIGWVDPAGDGPPVALAAGGDAPLALGVTPDGAAVAHVTATPDDPGPLVLVRVADGRTHLRCDRNPWRARIAFGRTERVAAGAPDGGRSEAWLTLPPPVGAAGPAPLVVSVHGGPHYAVGPRFSFEAHRIAARGYAVLAGNPRGSAGYGDAFAEAIAGDWGGPDLADTLALTEAAGAHPAVDGARVAITGVSYGGWMTLWAIARTDRFRAAIAENPIADLLSAFGSGEDDGAFWADSLGGAPWELPDRYAGRSPLVHADAIRTPLLLLHAELDRNCPPSQSAELFTALRGLGRTVRYLRARAVGHLMNFTGTAAFRAARADAVDAWLDAYLRDDDARA